MSSLNLFKFAVIILTCDFVICQQVLILTDEQKQEFVDEHNRARRKEAAVNMYEMVWNEALSNLAGQWASRCEGRHSPTDFRLNIAGFDYVGENLFFDGNQTHPPPARRAMNFWYNEKFLYKWTTGHCKPGTDCLHYTQVVWWDSCAVGCAVVKCETLTLVPTIPAGYLVNCIYGPGGNIPGEKPYKKGSQCAGCKNKCYNGFCSNEFVFNHQIKSNSQIFSEDKACPISYDEIL